MYLRSGKRKPENGAGQPKRSRLSKEKEASPPPRANRQIPSPRVTDAQKQFNALYQDLSQPGAFTSKIRRYLRQNVIHSIHKSKRRNFPRRRIVTYFPGNIIQSDLIDLQKYASSNSGYNYILVVIDCFSKKLWTRPLKTKSGKETADGLRSIFESMKYPVQSIIFDEGLEYVNKYVSMLLQEYNIYSYHIRTQHKASTAERVNQTIKKIIWKYFSQTNRHRWVDILDKLTDNYNKTYHTTIKMTPNEVTWENRSKVFKTMFPKIKSKISCRLKKGDKVRIALNKNIFEKGYTQNWSSDIFVIDQVFQKNGICWYRLKDKNGEIYSKSKYFFQLNKV